MTLVTSFRPPGNVPDNAPEAWHTRVAGMFAEFTPQFEQFYDPTSVDTPENAQVAAVTWTAFPASLEGSAAERLEQADASRAVQDEYCEWAVERVRNKITRVTFTTEVPEFWGHLFETDRAALEELYRLLVDQNFDPSAIASGGEYVAANAFNNSTSGRPAHLIQGSNSLHAAVALAAQATVLRKDANGDPVTQRAELVDCGGLGNAFRNSDPQIAEAVNQAAAAGAEVTLQDPVGLYLDGLTTGGMQTPDSANPIDFWTVERGDADHVVRAAYEVPEERGYTVGDITINGDPIDFGGQLAQRVRVRLEAVVKPGTHKSERQPCVG